MRRIASPPTGCALRLRCAAALGGRGGCRWRASRWRGTATVARALGRARRPRCVAGGSPGRRGSRSPCRSSSPRGGPRSRAPAGRRACAVTRWCWAPGERAGGAADDRLPAALRASERARRAAATRGRRCTGWRRSRIRSWRRADKREWLRRLARLAFAVEADFSLWRVCRAYPAERYVAAGAGAARRAPAVAARRGARTCRGTRRICASCARSCPRSTSRSRCAASGRRFGRACCGLDRARRRVEALFGVAAAVPIPASELEALIVAEERAFAPRRGVPAGCGARRRASCSGCCAARRAAGSPSPCWTITGSRRR